MIEELYASCYVELLNWCQTMTQNREQAEDLVQEAFLRAMKNEALLGTLKEKQRRSWLYRTVKNLFVDKVRHARFEVAVEKMPEGSGEEQIYNEMDSKQLLTVLSEEERMLFVMRYLWGYNSAELGELFELPPGTVRAKLFSARKILRDAMKET